MYWHGATVNLFGGNWSVCSSPDCMGAGAVYRVSFALAVFFFSMWAVTLCSSDVESFDYNNFGLKSLYFAALAVGVWYVTASFKY
jgi:hypothetical protein